MYVVVSQMSGNVVKAGTSVLLLLAACLAGAQTPASPAAQDQAAPTQQAPAQSATPQTAAAQQAPPAAPQGGTIRGTVVAGTAGKPGAVPLPGVSVTATNTLTGRKYTAATDIDGAYVMTVPRSGRYVVRTDLTGFAPSTQEVVISGIDTSGAAAAGITIVVKPTDFGLQLASRAAAAEAAATTSSSNATLRRGVQSLNLNAGALDTEDASASGGNTGVAPTMSGFGDASGAEDSSIVVSGQQGTTNALGGMSEDELRQRVEDGVAQARASGLLPANVDPTSIAAGVLGGLMNGGPGGPGGPGGRGGPRGGGGGARGGGGGNFRNFNPTQPHGGLNYAGDFSQFDSAPWSTTLLPQRNASYAHNTFGASITGSPYIPGLFKPSTRQFAFLNVNITRNTTPVVFNETVPTDAERNGDFSGLTQTINGQVQQTPIYDPANPGQVFRYNGVANVIDPARISQQAKAVLAYYPHANVPNAGTQNYNYNAVTTQGVNSANLALRFQRSLGKNASGPFGFGGGGRGGGGGGGRGNRNNTNAPPVLRQSMNTNFNYSHQASDQRLPILALGGSSESDGYNLGVGYSLSYGRISNNATLTWNRSHADTSNYFTNTAFNPAAAAGINVPSQGALGAHPAFYNGLPTLTITNFLGVQNTNPVDTIGQTISFSDFVSWRHLKHNMRFGGDIRRVHQDSIGAASPLGTFAFSGFNTEAPCDQNPNGLNCPPSTGTTRQASSGAGFADFLLGLPQQSTIQAGLNKIYLRENVIDWYATDDYRLRSGLTLNFGLRWEYFAPFFEKNDHLVNLTGVTSMTTSVGCVTPQGVTAATPGGPLTCAAANRRSLINPDRMMYSPRFSVAWHPNTRSKWMKDTVFRAAYGINYNTGQFATFARLLAYQPPFALNQNNVLNTAGCSNANLTLANGFSCSTLLYQNSFAVNPLYRLGFLHVYNADIQRTLPGGILLNLGYNGSKGSDLDVTRAPNHTPTNVTTPNAAAFRYEDSIAASNFNALTVNARKRLQGGVSLQATYQFAHSIDDASSIGGTSNTSSIQNDARLDLERSNSALDVRHKLNGSWIYELPVGPNRHFLNKGGFWAGLLDGYSLSGNFTFASGSYFTPTYSLTAAEISAGGQYTLRPNRDFTQPIQGAGTLRNFFNKNAFTAPLTYGTASRYSIEGPGQVVVSAALSRTVKLGDTRSFEGRLQASNVFNTVQYKGINTDLSAATFGQVTSAASMRQIQFTGRYRF